MALIKSFLKAAIRTMLGCMAWLKLRFLSKPTLIILTYHRILPSEHPTREFEQPGMVTSAQNLKMHIEFFRKLGATPMHLDEWLERKKHNEALPRLAISFTFDDGWRDNYQYAFPLLKANDLPFTIFLVSQLVNTQKTFWPEQVIKLLTSHSDFHLNEGLNWLLPYLPASDPAGKTERGPLSIEEADKVVCRLKALDDIFIIDQLTAFYKNNSQLRQNLADRSILSSSELQEMGLSDLARFGAHTRNHFRLNRLQDKKLVEQEIVGCLEDIKRLNDKFVPIFCYPNGDLTEGGSSLVKRHYRAACTTASGLNRLDCNPYQLKRFSLHDGNSSSTSKLLATIGRGLL